MNAYEIAPHQYAKFTHKSLLFNYSVLPCLYFSIQ